MAKILKADIKQGTPIEPWHISQFANALTAKEPYDLSISGSLTISGSTYLKPSGILRTPQEYLLSFNNICEIFILVISRNRSQSFQCL